MSESSSVIPHSNSSISWFNMVQQHIIYLNMGGGSRNKWNAISVTCRLICDHTEFQITSQTPPPAPIQWSEEDSTTY
jgi:hypothetical protein